MVEEIDARDSGIRWGREMRVVQLGGSGEVIAGSNRTLPRGGERLVTALNMEIDGGLLECISAGIANKDSPSRIILKRVISEEVWTISRPRWHRGRDENSGYLVGRGDGMAATRS